MTVRELIDELEAFPDGVDVTVTIDPSLHMGYNILQVFDGTDESWPSVTLIIGPLTDVDKKGEPWQKRLQH